LRDLLALKSFRRTKILPPLEFLKILEMQGLDASIAAV
jgi:hypothetical protein